MTLASLDDELEGLALIRAAHAAAPGEIALVSSFGAESAVLLDMWASVDRYAPVIFLETGKLFAETLVYRDELCAHLGLRDVRAVRPDANDLRRHDHSGDLHRRDADLCCYIRKTDPLTEALAPFVGWVNGRKRFQGASRASLSTIEHEADGRIKLNPLAHWTAEDIRHYRRLRQLPLHPLILQGYGSIGCAPCTSPLRAGEDARAGRWRCAAHGG